jgi:hypothetical protein
LPSIGSAINAAAIVAVEGTEAASSQWAVAGFEVVRFGVMKVVVEVCSYALDFMFKTRLITIGVHSSK